MNDVGTIASYLEWGKPQPLKYIKGNSESIRRKCGLIVDVFSFRVWINFPRKQ